MLPCHIRRTTHAGVALQAFQHALTTTHRSVLNEGACVNNEHITVYFVRLPQRIPAQQFVLQEAEVRLCCAASVPLQLHLSMLCSRLLTCRTGVSRTWHRQMLDGGVRQVSSVRYIHVSELLDCWDRGDPTFVGISNDGTVSVSPGRLCICGRGVKSRDR